MTNTQHSTRETISQIWTSAVAYVALAAGAGLSIAFNVVDTMANRGAALDQWDVVTAVAFPALVVLMVEMFVSRLWIGQPAPMQILRWVGTIGIGAIAMRVSWTHGHDFFLARGQTPDVAGLGPLAVDALAIMATALIVAGRGQAVRARAALASAASEVGQAFEAVMDPATYAAGQAAKLATVETELATAEEEFAAAAANAAKLAEEVAATEADVAKLAEGFAPGQDEPATWLDRLDSERAAWATESTLAVDVQDVRPVSPAGPSNKIMRPEDVPADVQQALAHWFAADPKERPRAGQVDEAIAALAEVSPRQARRYRSVMAERWSQQD